MTPSTGRFKGLSPFVPGQAIPEFVRPRAGTAIGPAPGSRTSDQGVWSTALGGWGMDTTQSIWIGGCTSRVWHFIIAGTAALLLGSAPGNDLFAADAPVRFNQDIRPILAENCFHCHGPDSQRRSAGLRLDIQSASQALLGSGARAIVPGAIDSSELVARIDSHDPSEQMPPPDSGKSLSSEDIELLKRWIATGAKWEGHWAFQPIERPEVPPPADPTSIKNPIDAFVQKELREHHLAQSARADRVALLRRISFDLIGLPPSTADLEQFLADDSPEAFERVVDRLLASSRFGERMAIGWLDLVRYADSIGFFADQPVKMSPYRDYVIGAFNANMPFDQFTIEQLAGDLLPDPGERQMIAVGYNRLGRMSTESGVQEKEYLSKYIAERVRNAGTTWLGLTLGCCECHDHKFDPLKARDFYQFAAFFADIKERGVYLDGDFLGIDYGPSLQLGTREQIQKRIDVHAEIQRIDVELGKLKTESHSPTRQFEADLTEWLSTFEKPLPWRTVEVSASKSTGPAHFQKKRDNSIRVRGPRTERETYTLRGRAPSGLLTAVRLEVLPEKSLPGNGPGRGADGEFVLTHFDAKIVSRASGSPVSIPFRSATATFEQSDAAGGKNSRRWSAAAALGLVREKGISGWSVTGRTGVVHTAIFETTTDVEIGADDEIVFELQQNAGDGRSLGRFRLSVAGVPRPVETAGYRLPSDIRDVILKNGRDRSQSDFQALREYVAVHVANPGAELLKRRARLVDQRSRLNREIPSVLTVERVDPRPIRVLKRGNWQDETGEIVLPGVPGFLPPLATSGKRATRLDLARWIVSRDNPLTARVLVNRLWKMYFGEALSPQVDNLGTQGDWPSHPELLDWLAAELIESHWDLKHLIRLIVTSESYRQSSRPSTDASERDPENRWLSHQGKFRLDAELIRDNALAVSGLLSPRVGGESVMPYQPEGYWDYLNKPLRTWNASPGDGVYRRGLYTHWQRQFLHPMLQTFDAPSREECAASRPRSSTPLQALVLLNDPTFVEAARALAQSTMSESGSHEQTLDLIYRRALSRSPSRSEQVLLMSLYHRHLTDYRNRPDSTAALLKTGRLAVPKNAEPAQIAAWTNVARVVLNHHEVLLRQ